MKRPTPVICSTTPNPNWTEKKCLRCGVPIWVLPSKADVVQFCSKACRVVPPMERLMAQVTKTPDGHWLFGGALNSDGYGNIKDAEGRQWRAHRLHWHLVNGPIPEGLDVLHRRVCAGHPECIALDHLYLGTARNNAGDRIAMGRQHDGTGEKCPTSKLTGDQVREIKARTDIPAEVFAKKFNVTANAIWAVRSGRTWKNY